MALQLKHILLLLWLALALAARSQDVPLDELHADSTVQYLLRMKDESQIRGTIIAIDGKELTVHTQKLGDIRVQRSDIASAVVLTDTNYRNGQFWFPTPVASRYYFAPSAIPMDVGRGYYQNNVLFINSFAYGLTRNVSIGAGFEVITLLARQPIWLLSAKAGFPVAKDIHLGAGTLLIALSDFSRYDGHRPTLGTAFGVATFGSKENNITFGAGYGYGSVYNEQSDPGAFRMTGTISGTARLGKRIAFCSENWILPNAFNDPILFSYGIRILGDRSSIDIALINNAAIAENIFPLGLPIVGYVVRL
jgi:hypothetical protein